MPVFFNAETPAISAKLGIPAFSALNRLCGFASLR